MKALFASKEATLTILFCMLLRDYGYEAIEAFTVAQAWDQLELENPDICVLDCNLPNPGTQEPRPNWAVMPEIHCCIKRPVDPKLFMDCILALASGDIKPGKRTSSGAC